MTFPHGDLDMNKFLSTFTKRAVLAASIALLTAQTPATIFANEPEKSPASAGTFQVDEFEEQIDDADEPTESAKPANAPKPVTKKFNIKLSKAGNEENDVIFIKQPGTPAIKADGQFNIKIASPPAAGSVEAKEDRLIFTQEGSEQPIVIPFAPGVRSTSGGLSGGAVVFDNASPYWIGTELRPLNGTMRWMMKLPEDQGVALFKVSPDSPAAKAGLKERDILIKVNDTPLGSPTDLNQAITKKRRKRNHHRFHPRQRGRRKND